MGLRATLFLVLGVILLINIVSGLPVKSSTQKPEEIKDEKDSPILENAIEYER